MKRDDIDLRSTEFAIAESQTNNEAVSALRDEYADDERFIHEGVTRGYLSVADEHGDLI